MTAFCGRCGATIVRPDQRFCVQCGAPVVGGPASAPASAVPAAAHQGPVALAPASAEVPMFRPWELAVLGLTLVVWAALSVWVASPTAASLARGAPVAASRLLGVATVLILPVAAIVVVIACRLYGRPAWGFAAPMLVVSMLVALALPGGPAGSSAAARVGLIQPSETPVPTATPAPLPAPGIRLPILTNLPLPLPIPTGFPIPLPIPTGLPIPLPIPTGLPIPLPTGLPSIPNLLDGNATPVPSARLNPGEARRLVRESLGRCLLLRAEVDLARVAFDSGVWTVTLSVTKGSWRVDDATGAVTPDPDAQARQSRECR